jgi:Putative prokaryotic signal transducing protein
MKEVFTDRDYTIVGFLKGELDAAGIPNYVQNQYTNTSMTGIPTALFWPVLCVTNDDDCESAKTIVASFVAARKTKTDQLEVEWRCASCGEMVPGEFESCWKCEEPKQEP